MRRNSFLATASAVAIAAMHAPAFAQEAETASSNVFELGQINVVAPNATEYWQTSGQAISESTISSDEMYTFDRNRLDDALTLVPGVTTSTGGARNEPSVSVRGFNLWQVPLYIDGVRVYLPYDNRLDIGRFITPDLSEVQVQKGYVSILNGPGGMGGAINLVTRKPSKEFEAELRSGVELGNTGAYSAFNAMGSVGIKQEKYYLQASGAVVDSDGWFLPQGFTVLNPAAEDGGRRDYSDSQDWRANVKVGFTPNETDEYALNYTAQQGEKGNPYDVYNRVRTLNGWVGTSPYNQGRNWTWPEWNYQSLYFLSKTAIGDKSYVNTRLYYTEFDNTLAAYDNSAYLTQSVRGFNSYYNDDSLGADLEVVHEIHPQDTIKAALTYRRDTHQSRNENTPGIGTSVWDPAYEQSEAVMSFGVENTFHVTRNFDFVSGVSYNHRNLIQADDYARLNSNAYQFFSHELTTDDFIDWQFAGIYRYGEDAQLNASVSSRGRFPTLFERFSTRFGTNIANPDLQAERATNYEIGWTQTFARQLTLHASVYYSQVTNLIQSVDTDDWSASSGTWITQYQNVGSSDNYGFEFSAEWKATDTLVLGGNYTYLQINISSPIPDIQPLGTPEHYAFLYAKWKAMEKLTLIPSVEISSSRWTNPSVGAVSYVETDGFVLANLSAEYQLQPGTTFSAGMRNIFDTEYETQYLFPQAGRSYFVNARMVF